MKFILFCILLLFINSIERCNTSNKKLSLDLSHGKINKFVYDSYKYAGITDLDLSDNKLDHIPNFVFELKEIEKINLSDNMIDSISHNIVTLQKLKYLILMNNELRIIPKEVQELKQLKLLALINNPIPFDEYEYGKCLVCDNCTILISKNFIEYPPYCKEEKDPSK